MIAAEIFAFFGIFLILLFIWAETDGKKILGVFASLLLLLLGVWTYISGVGFNTQNNTIGSVITYTNQTTSTTPSSSNSTSISILNKNLTEFNQYTTLTIPASPITFSQLLGLSLILISLFSLLHFAFGVYLSDLRGGSDES